MSLGGRKSPRNCVVDGVGFAIVLKGDAGYAPAGRVDLR